MDKTRFNKLIEQVVELHPKGYKRPWHKLTVNEQLDASVIVRTKPQQVRPCEDCGALVTGRRCLIYNNRYSPTQGKRSQDDHWIKFCQTCDKRWDISLSKKDLAK